MSLSAALKTNLIATSFIINVVEIFIAFQFAHVCRRGSVLLSKMLKSEMYRNVISVAVTFDVAL